MVWSRPKTAEGPEFGQLGRCLVWIGTTNSKGYGVAYQGPKRVKAHRAAWEAVNGPIPEGMLVCHRCDNPPCMNVAHLFLGTNDVNVADKVAKARQSRGSGHGRARLTEEDVIRIRKRLFNGEQCRVIARDFSVSEDAIGAIKRGLTWTHVGG